MEEKSRIRKEVFADRKRISDAEVHEKSLLIMEKILALPAYQESREVPYSFYDNGILCARELFVVEFLLKYLCYGFYSCFWILLWDHEPYMYSPPFLI